MFFKNIDIFTKIKNNNFQRLGIALFTLFIVYIIVFSSIGFQKNTDNKKSGSNIIEEKLIGYMANTSDNKEVKISVDVYDKLDNFFTSIYKARDILMQNPSKLDFVLREFQQNNKNLAVYFSNDSALFLIKNSNILDIYNLRNILRESIANAILYRNESKDKYDLLMAGQKAYNGLYIPDEIKIIGSAFLQSVLEDIYSSNLLIKGGYSKNIKALSVFFIISIMMTFVLLYIKNYNIDVFSDKKKILLVSLIFIITLAIAKTIAGFFTIGIPVFISAVLISILLDVNVAIVVNVVLTVVISLIIPIDLRFVLMSLISGSYSAIIAVKANKKNRLFLCGIIIGLINAVVVSFCEVLNNLFITGIAINALIAFLNGVVSIIIAIGILPFIETVFDIVSPVSLIQIMNPNHTLIKRLMIEAPGTYHHSLMVGNLAEAGADAIGANPFLARAGAYYHDIGKLMRPNFFMENLMVDNPHERLTPNLSTLVITSHTNDGYELAKKYKIPKAVRDIIKEHHGTTLVAYFYHKACKGEKGELTKEDNFRYNGPKPSSVESAVVMLADSVEAAVRAMQDKTEWKIEALIRKLIKDKIEDGQLVLCKLTLLELDNMAKAFINVFGGCFHEREAYPDTKNLYKEVDQIRDVIDDNKILIEAQNKEDGGDKFASTG